MSQDGRSQLIPRSIIGLDSIAESSVSCGGVVRDSRNHFARCSNGCFHCLDCSGPAKKFGRDWVCTRQCWKVK